MTHKKKFHHIKLYKLACLVALQGFWLFSGDAVQAEMTGSGGVTASNEQVSVVAGEVTGNGVIAGTVVTNDFAGTTTGTGAITGEINVLRGPNSTSIGGGGSGGGTGSGSGSGGYVPVLIVSPTAPPSNSGGAVTQTPVGNLPASSTSGSQSQTSDTSKSQDSQKNHSSNSGATISNVEVLYIKQDGATVTFESNSPSISYIHVKGAGVDRTLPVSQKLTTFHSVRVADLQPNSIYSFSIYVSDKSGKNVVYENPTYVFTTLGLHETQFDPDQVGKQKLDPSIRPVFPPSNFTAERVGVENVLTWKNPALELFENIMIVKSKIGFPQSIDDGILVYQGNAESFTDPEQGGGETYYSAFTVTQDKRQSYGVPAKAFPVTAVHTSADKPLSVDEQWVYFLQNYWYWWVLIILLLIFFWIFWKRRKKEDKASKKRTKS